MAAAAGAAAATGATTICGCCSGALLPAMGAWGRVFCCIADFTPLVDGPPSFFSNACSPTTSHQLHR